MTVCAQELRFSGGTPWESEGGALSSEGGAEWMLCPARLCMLVLTYYGFQRLMIFSFDPQAASEPDDSMLAQSLAADLDLDSPAPHPLPHRSRRP